MSNAARKAQADRILYEFGLLKKLEEIGAAHIIGSYRMDMMAWNDLDIDIENDTMSLDKIYDLTSYILETFHPVWYEAKEEVNDEGKTVWFQGFETRITGELWNMDLWFFDKETIDKAERYCDNISNNATPEQRETMIQLKTELIAKELYSFEQYKSLDVYKAVMEENVKTIDEFLAVFA